MQSYGLFKQRHKRARDSRGLQAASDRLQQRETRSFEVEYVGGLWHLDFHHCKRQQIVTREGNWAVPLCLAVMDDHSRLVCHVQWYLFEDTKHLVHGFSQALQRRGLPRALLSDNGSAMISAEFTQGLHRLSILHNTTLPYCPHQNGKQERFFWTLEERLVAMLENCKELSLKELNEATCAWVEMEYNRSVNDETKETPLERYMKGEDVSRKSPSSKELRELFRRETGRTQRQTDGSISVEGKRFEIPSRFWHLKRVKIRYARWDLSCVHLVDPDSGALLAPLYPLDKLKER